MTYRPLALKENKSTYLFRRPKQVQRDHQQDMKKKKRRTRDINTSINNKVGLFSWALMNNNSSKFRLLIKTKINELQKMPMTVNDCNSNSCPESVSE